MHRWALLLLVACHRGPDRAERAKGTFASWRLDPAGDVGPRRDDQDVLWAVPERDRRFVRLTLDGKGHEAYPMVGFPDKVDTEGLAWLGGAKFAVTTEGQDDPTASVIYAELVDGKLVAGTARAR